MKKIVQLIIRKLKLHVMFLNYKQTIHGHPEGGLPDCSKNFKTSFFSEILKKSFQKVTPMGPEPHQFCSILNISTYMVAKGI